MTIKPQPLTAANAELFQDWAAKIDAQIKAGSMARIERIVAEEMETSPEFANAVRTFDAEQGPNESLMKWATTDPAKAARIHRVLREIPMTFAALRMALECIRATAVNADTIDYDAITYEQARDYCALITDMTA